ncbi:hypothetical protein MED01_002367 [Micromonospora sp. MED01]|uniref:DUF7736 domain-containing protein n=1 Tax=Micromonospora alfalfae TaxID=2911212 RepID=UPI001EE79391|nr:hypothetical protein [Micromonospora alfalfae]MCG5464202.1 hypothetical protein [Micromonospora alfalfae]
MRFHLGDILTVTTDVFVAPDGFGAVHKLLDHMTGDTLFTHQLPRAADECKPELLRQHPDLAAIVPPTFNGEAHVRSWLTEQADRYGTHREVQPLPTGDHTRINPLDELAMNHPHLAVVPVVRPDDTP